MDTHRQSAAFKLDPVIDATASQHVGLAINADSESFKLCEVLKFICQLEDTSIFRTIYGSGNLELKLLSLDDSNSRIDLLVKIDMPSTHQVAILWSTDIIGL